MPPRIFTPEQDRMLAAEYATGKTCRELAKVYGGTNVSVAAAVRRGGGEIRRAVVRTGWSEECEPEAIRLYRGGMSVRAVATHFKTGTKRISDMLSAAGVELHPGGPAHPRFATESQCSALVDQYEAGASLAELAKRYGCSPPAVASAIKRANGRIRGFGVSKTWTPDVDAWVVAQHQSGRSHQAIADELGVSQSAVSRRLRTVGVFPAKKRATRATHGSWKGGRYIDKRGYVWVLVDEPDLPYCTPNSSGRVGEHRLVMGRAIGRPLMRHETVHHINGICDDNRLENLQLRQGNHGKGVVVMCNACGSHDVRAVTLDG